MRDQWYYKLNGEAAGPFSQQELGFLVSRGKLSPDDLVRQGKSGEWLNAKTVVGLFAAAPQTAATVAGTTVPRQPSKITTSVATAEPSTVSPVASTALSRRPPPPIRRNASRLQRSLVGSGIATVALLLIVLLLLLLLRRDDAPVAQGGSAESGDSGITDKGQNGEGDGDSGGDSSGSAADMDTRAGSGGTGDGTGGSGGNGTGTGDSADSSSGKSSGDGEDSDLPSLPLPSDVVSIDAVAPAAGGGDDGGSRFSGGAEGGGDRWDSMIKKLRRDGLEIVICFDSTGSMGGEIEAVKTQIKQIGTTLDELVPRTQIGVCTYRDHGDEYVVAGLPLTSDINKVGEFLASVSAGGGGDGPEAVEEGLAWSVKNNRFRRNARKVILIFGDAPPHGKDLELCKQIATDFRQSNKGVVSTITCRGGGGSPLSEFAQIAEAGGGEAFTTADTRELMEQLVVLVFGGRYREKVLEAFRLMDGG